VMLSEVVVSGTSARDFFAADDDDDGSSASSVDVAADAAFLFSVGDIFNQ